MFPSFREYREKSYTDERFLKGENDVKFELFVDQPNLDLKQGIKVAKDTEITYANGKVTQTLKDLVLEIEMKEEGTNGFNSYESMSHIKITLNAGDILLFHEDRGYYLSPYPVESIDDAISDINSLSDIPRFKESE